MSVAVAGAGVDSLGQVPLLFCDVARRLKDTDGALRLRRLNDGPQTRPDQRLSRLLESRASVSHQAVSCAAIVERDIEHPLQRPGRERSQSHCAGIAELRGEAQR